MKQSVSTPVIIGVIVVALAFVAFLFVKNVSGEPHTPRPDPAMFGYGKDGKAPASKKP